MARGLSSEGMRRVAVDVFDYGDSAALDAFSRLRTSSPAEIFDNKNIATKNSAIWEEVITGAIITYDTLVGTFQAAEEIRGTTTPITIGTIVSDNGTSSMTIDVDHNDFQAGDTITGQTSGATANVLTTDTGSDIQHDYNTSSVTLTTGTGATDSAFRQTHRYHHYIPGKSQLIVMTGIFGEAVTNTTRRMGYYNGLNGIYLEQTDSDIACVIRSSTSGTAVDSRTVQDDWNLDKLDGAGPSSITLDLSMVQILVIDFQWLGAGRIRTGFDFGGKIVYVHEVITSNSESVVYMKTASLPIKYEIFNTGTTSGQNTMSEICSSVVSEGGFSFAGFENIASRGITEASVTTTLVPILAIRLKNEFPTGEENRRLVKFDNAGFVTRTNDARFEIRHYTEAYDMTATWSDVAVDSAVEYSTDISAISGRFSHTIEEVILPAAQGGKTGSSVLSGDFINLHSFISQSHDSSNSEIFVVHAQARTGTANVLAHINWIEYD